MPYKVLIDWAWEHDQPTRPTLYMTKIWDNPEMYRSRLTSRNCIKACIAFYHINKDISEYWLMSTQAHNPSERNLLFRNKEEAVEYTYTTYKQYLSDADYNQNNYIFSKRDAQTAMEEDIVKSHRRSEHSN